MSKGAEAHTVGMIMTFSLFVLQVEDWVAPGEVELMSTSSTLVATMPHVTMIVPSEGERSEKTSVLSLKY